MTPEIELKLDISSEDADRLVASTLLGVPSTSDHRSVYFDTPDHALVKSGFSLRIRHVAETRIQTVKASGSRSLGLFVRPEWERQIQGDSPELDVSGPLRASFGEKVEDLGPIFETRVRRQSWLVERPDAIIEVVLDRGEIDAGDRLSPICEVELELKSGSRQALFELARDIHRIAPLAPGVLSKAERGYRLLEPKARAMKAEPIDLDPAMSTAQAFTTIAGACLRQFRINETLSVANNGEAVHQSRIALRRLRSALAVFKRMLAGADLDRLNAEVKWLAGELGKARDLDVLLPRVDDSEIRAKVRLARAGAFRDVAATLKSDRKRQLMLDLIEWLTVGPWLSDPDRAHLREDPAKDFSRIALDRCRKKVKKRGRDLQDTSDETRHQVRKDAKKMRYAADFFAALFAAKKSRARRQVKFTEALDVLQDGLGTLNDIASARSILQGIGLETDAPAKLLIPAGSRRDLLASASEAYEDFVAAKRFWT